ncbi:MAG: RimK family protein [Gammaproteobacteria bacterium]|nr:RimK family protein [Gammaproteobacteria bacterium]
MTTQIIVVEDPADWKLDPPEGIPIVNVDDYLTGQQYLTLKNVQVINLCRSYKYLTVGYYCSLLAQARRHRVVPSVKSILDLSSKAMYSLDAEDLDEKVEKSLGKRHSTSGIDEFRMEVYFGQCFEYPELSGLARQLFEAFPCPFLRITFERDGKWRIASIKSGSIHKLNRLGFEHFAGALAGYQKKRWRSRKKIPSRYDLAILYDPIDPQPPSKLGALKKFIRAGRELGVNVQLIERKDYARLAEYDALLIRVTTRINHYTFRFSKKAESEGMVVIDDPRSILRCTNKVYLAELLRANKVPAPKTVIVGKNDVSAAEEAIGFPMVMKIPDGSFSQGVFKVNNREEMIARAEQLFERTELFLAQEFLYTEFDWRIGILNRKPLFACQYFMTKKHWQIVHYDGKGKFTEGAFKTWPVEEAPKEVVDVALKAANLIGDGLYGVDVKQNKDGVYVIEVNDNPNIDAGIEDKYLENRLYEVIIGEFVRRLDLRRTRER